MDLEKDLDMNNISFIHDYNYEMHNKDITNENKIQEENTNWLINLVFLVYFIKNLYLY